jgi:hypothetical protein
MTTLAWIHTVAGLVMGTIALTAFFGMRKMRGSLTRQSLPVFIFQLVIWSLFGVFFFSGVLSVMYFATIAVVFVPTIVWILRLPKDNHVA